MNESQIFTTALKLATDAERAAYLEEVCAGNPELRTDLEALLQAHAAEPDFLEQPAFQPDQRADDAGVPGAGDALPPEARETEPLGGGVSLDFLIPSDKPGSLGRLGHYDIFEVVGQGGMGIVLKAVDEELQRVVAIKVMGPHLAFSGTGRQRFVREARAAAAVRNDYVVNIYAVEAAGVPPYLVMEYVAGASLQERLDGGGPLGLKEILRIGLQSALGLAAAHAQGLIHRDIKPANILLENGVERVKITDFGLARAVDDASLSQSGVVSGTPMYMSPEQAAGEAVDHRTDLFSLGSVLYAMCTGRAPFRASGTMAVLKRVCEDTPRPIRELNPEVPDWLCAIIARLHAKKPAERFQSAQEVAELLEQHLAHLQQPGQTPLPAPVPRPARRRPVPSRWLIGVAVSGLLATLLIFAVVTNPNWFGEDENANPDPVPKQPPIASTPFVILAEETKDERAFATLAEAVEDTRDGDTIEIRSNGPFVTPALYVRDKALSIRAGQGFHPVIQLNEEGIKSDAPLIRVDGFRGSLALEGLEIHGAGSTRKYNPRLLISAQDAVLHVTNCRFIHTVDAKGRLIFLYARQCALLQVRNCQFVNPPGDTPILYWGSDVGGKGIVKNCLFACEYAVELPYGYLVRGSLTLENNTLATDRIAIVRLYKRPDETKPLNLEARDNILGGQIILWEHKDSLEKNQQMSAQEAETLLQHLIHWKQARNLHGIAPGKPFLIITGPGGTSKKLTRPYSTLAEWQNFWGLEALDSLQGVPVFQGGDLLARAIQNPAKLVPEDFRLAPGSPGKGAGPDGKDLGADIDLVGPGPAYERWRKTPDYQQWLKDTGQMKQ